jgi:hypothetical protein
MPGVLLKATLLALAAAVLALALTDPGLAMGPAQSRLSPGSSATFNPTSIH